MILADYLSLIYKEICNGIDDANKEIKQDGAWVGYPYYLEIINRRKEKWRM